MKLFIYIFLASNLFGQVATLHDLEPGKRENSYRVWIYFDERDHNRIVDLDPKSIERRKSTSEVIPDSFAKPTKNSRAAMPWAPRSLKLTQLASAWKSKSKTQ